ncbi:MAG: phage replisome organizer N-terminal domain-containing protein [Liquorilactobacillus nagelii]|uniref:phage replisome organizer N-terminal domain-containing protein n=1 Tax=Liquorilactobacillus satsumensis TaxID=259059 RepID=UPI0039E88591
MADSKKYYYLKLKDNFFDSDEILVLESMQDGYKYENILLKLYLRSLKYQGKLMLKDLIPFNSQTLATVTRHSVGDVEKAIKIFKQLGLIDIMDNGAIYMLDIQEFIGKSSTEADRKKAYRLKIQQEKGLRIGNGQMSGQTSDKRTPERELELELEREKDIEIEKPYSAAKTAPSPAKAEQFDWKAVIDYLNAKAKKNFKHVNGNKKWIVARFKDGYTLEDMKKVIDNQCVAWKGQTIDGKPAENYLRPETLFRPSKIEGYLNAKPSKGKQRYNRFEGENDPSVYDNLPF